MHFIQESYFNISQNKLCLCFSVCLCVNSYTQTCTSSLISPDDVTWDASLSSDGGSFQFFRPESDCMHLLPGGPTWSLIGFICIYHVAGQLLDRLVLCSFVMSFFCSRVLFLKSAWNWAQLILLLRANQGVFLPKTCYLGLMQWLKMLMTVILHRFPTGLEQVCAHDMHKHCGLTFNCHVTWTDIMSPCCVCGTTYHNLTRSCIVLLPLTWFLSPMIRSSGKAKEKGKFFLLIFLFSLLFGWVRKWWISCAVIFIAVWGLLLINLHARHVLAHCQGVILMFREQT